MKIQDKKSSGVVQTSILALSLGRIAIGTGLIASPRLAAGEWLGSEDIETRGARVLSRALGARDIGIGAGTLVALRESSAETWVRAAVLADAVDFLATAAVRPQGTPRGLASLYLLAGGAAAVGLWLQGQMD